MNSILKVDKPITKISEDFLGRKDFSSTITNAIIEYNDVSNESLTIGLYGEWGSGKTSIINMIIEDVEKEDDILVFKFEPWLYSDTQQLISQFFKDFSKIISHKEYGKEAENIGKELETYATFFDLLSLIPEPTTFFITQGVSKVFKSVGKSSKKWGNLKSKNLSELKISIEKHLRKLNKKILIVIDDIDRLNNTEIRQIFQLIKSLGNFPNTIYIASMDRNVVVNALQEVQQGNGSDYLEKIIHVPLNVPSISEDKVHEFLFSKFNEILKNVQDKDFDQTYWGNVYHSGFKHFFKNIRDVVRYINVLRFNFSAIGSNVNIVDLIAITGVQVFEPQIYTLIKNNPNMFTGSNRDGYSNNDTEEQKVKVFFENSYEKLEKIDSENYLTFMQELFIKIKEIYTNTTYTGSMSECRKEGKLCSPEFFNIYFKTSLDDKIISKPKIEEYISKASDEANFREAVLELNKSNMIYKFLDRLNDYAYEMDNEKSQVISKVLIDLGDSFPERKGMFSFGKEIYVGRSIYQLLNKLSKEERFEILNESISNAVNSIDISIFEVSAMMEQHGEYEKEAKPENEQFLTNDNLQELKRILARKIQEWTNKFTFKDEKISTSLLYMWKQLDNNAMQEYLTNTIQENNELMYFLKIFNTVSYSQILGDYTERENKEFAYESMKNFIAPSEIYNRIKILHDKFKNKDDISDELKFSMKMFINYYDGNIIKEDF